MKYACRSCGRTFTRKDKKKCCGPVESFRYRGVHRPTFAVQIMNARLSMSMSTTETANAVEINRNTYMDHEAGRTDPTFRTGMRLCRLFNLDPWEFFENARFQPCYKQTPYKGYKMTPEREADKRRKAHKMTSPLKIKLDLPIGAGNVHD